MQDVDKSENAPKVKKPSVLAFSIVLILGYIVTSPIGAPLLIISVLTHSKLLAAVWTNMTYDFLSEVLEYRYVSPHKQKNPVSEVAPAQEATRNEAPVARNQAPEANSQAPEPEATALSPLALLAEDGGKPAEGRKLAPRGEWLQVQLDDGAVLTVAREGEIYRRWILRSSPGLVGGGRDDLTYLFPQELLELGYQVSVAQAMTYTMHQIQRGIFAGVPRQRTASVAKSVPEPEKKTQVEDKTQPSAERPKAKSESTSTQDAPARKSAGRVVFAGVRQVRPEGKPPYEIFTVVLETKNGEEVTFAGVDLSEKFQKGQFVVGDVVRIGKTSVSYRITDRSGEERQRRKNEFSIERVAA